MDRNQEVKTRIKLTIDLDVVTKGKIPTEKELESIGKDVMNGKVYHCKAI